MIFFILNDFFIIYIIKQCRQENYPENYPKNYPENYPEELLIDEIPFAENL